MPPLSKTQMRDAAPARVKDALVIATIFLLLATAGGRGDEPTPFKRDEDVIYGRKFGTALTLDVFTPGKPNGLGVIWVVSGGWISAHEFILPPVCEPFLKRGYTVFAVVHGSQPKFHIPEIIQDLHRAVRFVRFNAGKYGVDANRLGVIGASAGGHLSLMLATQGGSGPPGAKDPTDRQSSAVRAVACFFPPTDFLNYGAPGESALGEGVLRDFKSAFGEVPAHADAKQKFGREISPLYAITSNLPPTLIVHGDADRLVPLQQAESFVEQAKNLGATARLIVKEGKGHGWPGWLADLESCVDWFDAHLRGMKGSRDSE